MKLTRYKTPHDGHSRFVREEQGVHGKGVQVPLQKKLPKNVGEERDRQTRGGAAPRAGSPAGQVPGVGLHAHPLHQLAAGAAGPGERAQEEPQHGPLPAAPPHPKG